MKNCFNLILITCSGIGTINVFILQMKKPRFRKVKDLAQLDIADKQWTRLNIRISHYKDLQFVITIVNIVYYLESLSYF